MKHVIQIRRNFGKTRKHRISDVDYNNMVDLISHTETHLPKKLRVYSANPGALGAILTKYVGATNSGTEKRYLRLEFNSRAARDAGEQKVNEIKNGGKIIGYRADDMLWATTEHGVDVRLTKAVYAPKGNSSGMSDNIVAPVGIDSSAVTFSKTNVIIAIVALVAIIGFVIFKKKKK